MVPFQFCGHTLLALPQGALFWPKRRALIVADLHFEKASWFARLGQMLPPYDSVATLTDLAALAVATDCAAIWCLGDSFHDTHGFARMPVRAAAILADLTARHDWVWVTGNHDAGIEGTIGGHVVRETEIDGLVLRHEACPDDHRPELSGHFHPKLRIATRGRSVARRCFVTNETKLILPAFGALTGGLDVGHAAIIDVMGDRARALVPVNERLLSFPIAA